MNKLIGYGAMGAGALALVLLVVGKIDWRVTPLQVVLMCIAGAGAIGGLVNGLINQDGFRLPGRVQVKFKVNQNGQPTEQEVTATVWQLGGIGNTLVGAVAALMMFCLYGPLKDALIVGPVPTDAPAVTLALLELAGSFGVGFAGARIITNEVDKRQLRQSTAEAAAGQPNPQVALAAHRARPAELLALTAGDSTTNGNPPPPEDEEPPASQQQPQQ